MGDGIGFQESRSGLIPLVDPDGDMFLRMDPGLVVGSPSLLNLLLMGDINR